MRDGVGLHGTRPARVGRAVARGHGVPQQRAGPRGRESLFGMLHARRTQEAVDLRGTDRQKFFLESFGQRRAARDVPTTRAAPP